jgi:hypothetical protein
MIGFAIGFLVNIPIALYQQYQNEKLIEQSKRIVEDAKRFLEEYKRH